MKPKIKTYFIFIKKEIAARRNLFSVHERDMASAETWFGGVYDSKESAIKNKLEHEDYDLYSIMLEGDLFDKVQKNKADDSIVLPPEFFKRFQGFAKVYLGSTIAQPEASSSNVADETIQTDIDKLIQTVSDSTVRGILLSKDIEAIKPLLNEADASIKSLAKLKIHVLTKNPTDAGYAETIKDYLQKVQGKESTPGLFSSRNKKMWKEAKALLKKHFPDSPSAAPSSSSS